jgi:hypothetical protein
VRGLSQRYNAVWLNNTGTPSSEADVKAFSFDVIPASMIDNMIIVKSPAPELPADFSGGFVKIATVNLPFLFLMELHLLKEQQIKVLKDTKGQELIF